MARSHAPGPVPAAPPDQRTSIHEGLLSWYAHQRRDLPWRNTRDPYAILVAEVMLQQTQVDRVLPKYREFLERFPTVEALARSSPAEVIRCWSGLGYNVRAVRLQEAARRVVSGFGGRFPRDLADLLALPGLGPYSARALACFAYEADVPVVDTNVRRVLGRAFRSVLGADPDDRTMLSFAGGMLPAGRAYAWNQALMDLGATVCTSRKPLCLLCPLQASCDAVRDGVMLDQPERLRAGATEPFVGSARYYRGRILAALRMAGVGETFALPDLGRMLKDDFSAEDEPWLLGLLRGLQRDGLLTAGGEGQELRAALPERGEADQPLGGRSGLSSD